MIDESSTTSSNTSFSSTLAKKMTLPLDNAPKDEAQAEEEEEESPNTFAGRFWKTFLSVAGGVSVGIAVAVFSTYFPFMLDHSPDRVASTTVYQNAYYHYDPAISHFDNTFLTYGTDYILAVAMVISSLCLATSPAAARLYQKQQQQKTTDQTTTTMKLPDPNDPVQHALAVSRQLRQSHIFRSRGMLATYMLSVTAGGLAHQFFTTHASRNTIAFRILWTICVGSVTAASGWMGSIASAWTAYDQQWHMTPSRHYYCTVPTLSVLFWMAYAVTVTSVVVWGGWSYQRPAADIFVAGITQFPSTFYVMACLWYGLPVLRLNRLQRVFGLMAFIANAPLLPLYPVLIYNYASTGKMSLGQVNATLHANLLLAWMGQGYMLRTVSQCWEVACIPPPRALPSKKQKMR